MEIGSKYNLKTIIPKNTRGITKLFIIQWVMVVNNKFLFIKWAKVSKLKLCKMSYSLIMYLLFGLKIYTKALIVKKDSKCVQDLLKSGNKS